MTDPADHTDAPPRLDPLFVHARREALIILCTWATCLVWSVTTCITMGYDRSAEDIGFILGLPDWVFFGVCLPWGVAAVFSIVFVLFVMKDDDLGPDAMEQETGDKGQETGDRGQESGDRRQGTGVRQRDDSDV